MHTDTTAADGVDPQGGGAVAAIPAEESLRTVRLSGSHNVADFRCEKSPRVAGFFAKEAPILVPNYCRVFVLENPQNQAQVLGYYTLSAALLVKEQMSNSDEDRAKKDYLGYPAPVVRIGFMGRDDRTDKNLGAALLVDAARRVYRNQDIAAWGLVIEPENGQQNPKLWKWYTEQGFKPCRMPKGARFESMYAPLSAFLPELKK
jgi:hypothetical protein